MNDLAIVISGNDIIQYNYKTKIYIDKYNFADEIEKKLWIEIYKDKIKKIIYK